MLSTTTTPPPTDSVALLTLYEVNQDLLQGKIPQVIQLKAGKTVIGRGSQCDVILNAQRDGKFIISRNHASIEIQQVKGSSSFECVLQDLGAINGTYVNGMRIHRYSVKSGDIIQFGGMCDVPEGYILEHSDVSVKYKFQLHKVVKKEVKEVVKEVVKTAQKRKSDVASAAIDEQSNALANKTPNRMITDVSLSLITSSSGRSKHKKAKLASDTSEPSNLDKLLAAVRTRDTDDDPEPLPSPKLEEVQGSVASVGGGGGEVVLPSAPMSAVGGGVVSAPVAVMSEAVLEEVRQMKLSHERELVELRQHFQLLQQSLTRTEEHLAKTVVTSAPETVSEEKTADKLADLISRENDVLKSELLALRQQLSTALLNTSSPRSSPRNSNSSSNTTSKGVSKQKKAVKEKEKVPDVIVEEKKPEPAPAPAPVVTSSFCQVDLGSLTSQLTCVLCQHLLLDAVVLRCSHGFCRLCIERHVSRGESTCPICKDPPPRRSSATPSSSSSAASAKARRVRNVFADYVARSNREDEEVEAGGAGRECWYHRSDHLDSLVWLVLSASSEEVRQQFRQREEEAARELKEVFGVDVTAGYQFAEGAKQELPPHHRQREEEQRSDVSGRRQEDEEVLCEYCGGSAHDEGERCPHKENSSNDDVSEEEDF